MELWMKIILWISYLLALFFTIYWLIFFMDTRRFLRQENQKRFFPKKFPLVSIIVPAFDEEDTIQKTLRSVLALDYPHAKLELIVIDDGSKDATYEKIREIALEFPLRNIRFFTQKNQGKAVCLNRGLSLAQGSFFACLDADSFVEAGTLKRMLGYFESSGENLALVTPTLRIDKPQSLLQKFQRVEYITAMLIVRMMGHMDCIYIAPGPFTLYRTEIIRKLGGFDESNLTEDQEIAYRLQKHHYELKQCPQAYVNTVAPKSIGQLYHQRNRWFKGTLQNIVKYRGLFLNKEYGDFGLFQMPLNVTSFLLAIIATFFFGYYTIRPFFRGLYDLYLVGFDIWPYLQNLKFTFSLLDLQFGVLFVIYTLLFIALLLFYFGHRHADESLTKYGIWYLIPYFYMYYLFLAFVAIVVMVEMLIGRRQKW